MKICPRCSSEINVNDKYCPRCRLPVSKMVFNEDEEETPKEEKVNKNLSAAQKLEQKKIARKARREERKRRKIEQNTSNTDFSQFAKNVKNDAGDAAGMSVYGKKRKSKKADRFEFEVDENGEFNIDTSDVEIVGEETTKIIEEKYRQTYSVKKARGDYREPKIKWWEIYKLADRAFARRKIKKDISKAAKVKPDFVSKTKLLLLAIFFGWFGAHNFYAKNKRRGFVSLIFSFISITSGILINYVDWLQPVELWLIGFTGFVVILIWVSDIVNIAFNAFKYRIQIDKFISGMNVETRAKLGEKYIDLELLHKPWPVRFKVWCGKKKREFEEWKHDNKQRKIQKEKARQAKAEEKAKIDAEIAAYEEKENAKLKSRKEVIEEEVKKSGIIEEVKEDDFKADDNLIKNNKKNSNTKSQGAKKAKVSVKTNKKTNKKK